MVDKLVLRGIHYIVTLIVWFKKIHLPIVITGRESRFSLFIKLTVTVNALPENILVCHVDWKSRVIHRI